MDAIRQLRVLIKRNSKLFFKDKAMFITSLITPVILLVLYATFLAKVYRDSFAGAIPEGLDVADKLINGCVGGELISSILAVSCITVSFCSNMLMVQDKALGTCDDLAISPVKAGRLAISYYLSTLAVTLTICFVAMGVCLIYLANIGWYMSVADVFLMILDIFLLVMFGTALSSIVNLFLNSQGQISAVGTIVSSGYGFISGAYMPISSFGIGLQRVISFLPGTYGTSLLRNHALRGAFSEMAKLFPAEVMTGIKDSVDCNLYFFGNKVGIGGMYAVLVGADVVLLGVYILLHFLRQRKVSK